MFKFRWIKIGCIVLLAVGAIPGVAVWAAESEPDFPGERSEWNGYTRFDFELDGRACIVVAPELAAEARPWIWRARFFGHEPQTDLALLSRGFHLAYMDVGGMFGNPAAVRHWEAFYDYLTTTHGFSERAVLEGMSRGGLIALNWAISHPGRVACIYLDAAVCDIASWPGGRGAGKGSAADWERCLAAYGLDEEDAEHFRGNPIDRVASLASKKVPILSVCGDADDVVPMAENTAVLAERYRKLGGPIQVITKEGVGHHPHSLENPRPIVDFVLEHTTGLESYATLRDDFRNARIRFEREKRGRVAFLGGSITEMTGWRGLMCEWLQERFPETEFEFVDAGISSTDSTLGAFRLQNDVLDRGRIDLLFVEYAVNDQHNFRTDVERVRGLEGVIRQARTRQPAIDILVQYFVDPIKMELFRGGRPSPVIVQHEKVCRYYGIPVNDLAREVTDRIDRGEFTWEQFGGLHPAPFGHRVYADSMQRLFDDAWRGELAAGAVVRAHAIPGELLNPKSYVRGRFVGLDAAELSGGWSLLPEWNPEDGAGRRRQFSGIPILEATEAGAELRLEFQGTSIGLLVVAGPDVGVLAYTIDGKPAKTIDQFTRWSAGLHIPWAYVLDAELDDGAHELVLRTTSERHTDSTGSAARIVQFLVN